MPKSSKVKWRSVMKNWTALDPSEKILALAILVQSGKDGWANVSLGELQEASGSLHYKTIHKGVDRLEKLGALELADSDQKSKKLYRLHESQDVRTKKNKK